MATRTPEVAIVANEPVLYAAQDGVAVITLNRPAVLNSFNAPMLAAVLDSLHRAEHRGVLITGQGRAFSAGQDLAAIESDYHDSGGPDFVALLREQYHPVLRKIRDMPVPVIAAVNGVAAGAGMSLALACDLRLASDAARFTTAFSRIGFVPDAGMAYTLPRLVGYGRANWLLTRPEPIDAQTALAVGLVDEVIIAGEFADRALAFARQLACGPTRSYVLTRRLLDQGSNVGFDELLDLEAEIQAEAGATDDHRHAVAAFLQKRQPQFRGR